MAELRKVRIGPDYWHVVDDEATNQQFVGSLTRTSGQLGWRAEFAPLRGAPEDWAVAFLGTEMEALAWLETKVKGE